MKSLLAMQILNTLIGKIMVMDNTSWQLNDADPGSLDVQCTGLGGGELDDDWDILLACKKEAHVYGPSRSKQDDWNARAGTIAGTAHTQEYLLLHIAMFPISEMPTADQLQAQIISRAMKLLRFCSITPVHRKPPWLGSLHSRTQCWLVRRDGMGNHPFGVPRH